MTIIDDITTDTALPEIWHVITTASAADVAYLERVSTRDGEPVRYRVLAFKEGIIPDYVVAMLARLLDKNSLPRSA